MQYTVTFPLSPPYLDLFLYVYYRFGKNYSCVWYTEKHFEHRRALFSFSAWQKKTPHKWPHIAEYSNRIQLQQEQGALTGGRNFNRYSTRKSRLE